jgi:hypothetical protein
MPTLPLPPITDFEAYNKNTEKQYEALGRFVVAFEGMVDEARGCALNLLKHNSPNSALLDIAFHNPALTAKPTFDIFRAIVVEHLTLTKALVSPEDQVAFNGVLSLISGEYNELVSLRNTLLHGTWFVGYSSREDPNAENFILEKYKPTKKGLEPESVPKHAFELLALKDRCEDARSWIALVHFCVPRIDQPYDRISERFVSIGGKWHLTYGEGSVPEPLPRIPPRTPG